MFRKALKALPLVALADGKGKPPAVAYCLNATFMYYASARGVEIDELEIDLERELDLRGLLGLSDYRTQDVYFELLIGG